MQGVEAEWDQHSGKYKIYDKYGKDIAGDDIGVWYTFDTSEGEEIEVSMGVSFVSPEKTLTRNSPEDILPKYIRRQETDGTTIWAE